ncbi:DUF4185 domain-containing protein [Flindersiella endophytica]
MNTYGKGSSSSKTLGAPIEPVRETEASTQAVPGPSMAEQVAKLTGAGSINNTDTAYQVMGTDLGMMWDNGSGQVLMAFGDTYGEGWGGNGAGPSTADWRCNVLARSGDQNLADGVTFDDMIVDRPNHAGQLLDCKKIDRDEHTVIPNSGISVGNRQYIHYFSQNCWCPWNTNYAGIAYSDDNGQTWTKSPEARWQNTADWNHPFQIGAFAKDGGYVYLFGTANGRLSNIHLARVPEKSVLDKAAWRYWDGNRWQSDDLKAAPIVAAPSGELSVAYNKYLGRWIMMYLDENQAAIVMREASSPLGPWSGGKVVVRGGAEGQYGGLYAPTIHPWSTASGSPDLYFAMSWWPRYNVYLMKTTLDRAVDSANLVSDPGFENQVASRKPAPWRITGTGGIDEGGTQSHSGDKNGYVRAWQGWNGLSQTVAVRPGKSYRLTAWVRTSASATNSVLGVRGARGVIAEKPAGPASAYKQVTLDFKAGNETLVELYGGFWSQGKDTWFQLDDVNLRQL